VVTHSELDALLSQDPAAMREEERGAFDRIAAGRPIVLMGAGGLGRRALAGLRRHGVTPLAFADNATARHGTMIDGIPVMPPADAARRFGDSAVFVVTIWGANSPHRFAHSRDQLRALGCGVVASFPPLFWKYADDLLPFYLQDLPSRLLAERDEVARGFDLWSDEASRAEYVAQVRFRLNADFDGLPHPVRHAQYFPDDLFVWRDDEWIVDAGAYDGDTVRTIAALHGDHFAHLLAVEPDPSNFAKLQATVAGLPAAVRAKISCRHVAVAAAPATLHLDATGTASSATMATPGAGTVAVEADTIDSMTAGERPTFIKLDIEGFEIDALHGARDTIGAHAPIVAVCVYHVQDHLWRIPRLLRAWRDDYAFFLRPHNEEGWDLVCYAVPRARLRGGAR
jgi:FkbM family methyltransferase